MRKHLRHSLVAAVAIVLPLAFLSSPSNADDRRELERERSGVSGDLDDARESLNHSSGELSEAVAAFENAQAQLEIAEGELATVRGELSTARAHDAQMQAELTQAEEDLTIAEGELATEEERTEGASVEVKQQTLGSLQAAPDGLQTFGDLLKGDGPQELSERAAINRNADDLKVARLDRLDASRVWLDVQRDIVEELRDEVQIKREEAAANLQRVEELEAQAAAHEAEISELVGERSEARAAAEAVKAEDEESVADLERERRALEAQIQQIIREEEEAERERQRRAAQNNNNGGGGGSSSGGGGGGGGGGSSSGGGGGGGGSSSGGGSSGGGGGGSTLARPVSGYITSHFGNRLHPIYNTWRLHSGTDFGAPCGRPIYAAAGGRVIQSGWAGAYGNRIVINHGSMRGANVTTTYSHLSRFGTSSGANVSRGQLIGYVGTTGASTGCHLHFEVMRNGSFVNPMGWL